MKHLLILYVALIILSCREEKKCEDIYKNYVLLRMSLSDDKALKTLDKAIDCDTNNSNFRFEKVNYLIANEDYKKATTSLRELGTIDNSYVEKFPLLGVLEIRNGNKEKGVSELKKVYDNIAKVENKDFSLVYYGLLLELFFKGKKHTLLKLEEQKSFSNKNDEAVINHLKGLINSEKDSLSILYNSFQIIE